MQVSKLHCLLIRRLSPLTCCRQDVAAPSARALLAEVTDVYAPAPAPSTDVCDDKCQTQVRLIGAPC